jgi:hypothetical protein
MATIKNLDLLNEQQKSDLINTVKAMGEFWQLVEVCWYSDGSRAYIVTDNTGLICPSISI